MAKVVYHPVRVTKEEKNEMNKHKSPVIWLTGLSCSGKSTIANALEQTLFNMGAKTQVLDGDNLRMGLNNDLGFSAEDRNENIRRVTAVGKLFSDSGTITIAAFISPFESARQKAKEIIGEDNFIEVHVATPLEVCEARDDKGMYKKARAGEISDFTGIGSPYEEPTSPDIKLFTKDVTVIECVETIIECLVDKGIIEDNRAKEINNLDKKKTISIDFDGVIHKYSRGFQGLDNAYDPPMDGAVEGLISLHTQGYVLKILSSRPKEVIYPWLEKYGISDLIDEVSNHKFPATVYIDDRGFHFKGWMHVANTLHEHPKLKK